ncbi:sulfite exporter TauE/SafE family protein [Polynucleobacter sp. IMCC 30228]|uniref:sulfite exporter TauE/SafE family protein n=1 Tax=Polynucleobacter sp. IMCC 30228 TaxID=2781011 RepID=UPI0021081BA3|nr:sulfite exporter TauE/SafE family protein [Polynucleobacter sp. IMCC 30228]
MGLFLLATTALLAGTFIGAVGVGGVLLIPALIAFAGLDIHQASASALITFIFTGALGTYLFQRRGSINWRMSVPVCLGTLIASYLGAEVNAITGDHLLIGIIGLLVIAAGVWALTAPISSDLAGNSASQVLTIKKTVVLILVGLIAGFGSGLSGAGGPLFFVPLMLVLKFSPLLIIGIAQVIQIIGSSSGSVANILNSAVDFKIVAFILPFELIGIWIGVIIAHRVRVDRLKKVAAWLCILVGIYMTVNSLV